MGIFKRRRLKATDDVEATAAELTLRKPLYPPCLVTALSFLWVTRNI
jgi:hypothetical protein